VAAAALIVVICAGLPVVNRDPTLPQPAPEVTKASIPAPLIPALREVSDFFRRNETITQALARHGLSREQILSLVECTRPVYALSKVIAGREFKLHFWNNTGLFKDFIYAIDADRYLTVYRSGGDFVPLVKNFDFDVRTEAIEGTIEDSLFAAIGRIGEQDQLALNLSEIFQWDVDFYTDLQRGDTFRLLVEKKYLDGAFVRYGDIVVADLTVQNKSFSAYRFQNAYYDRNGKALRRDFLKSPLRFTRISSRFSSGRMHPILRIVRPHYGVDYAAPAGTPVHSVASGKVVSAGVNGGYGKSVRVRHPGGYESMYSHLSRIAVRTGQMVSQGDLIGNVGATGLATGPHLDFRLFLHAKPMNPAKMILPPAQPVPAALLAQFAALRDELRNRLAGAGGDPAQTAKNDLPGRQVSK
jgi:murein DD-endopeptidase MepM/ murein hydrolase activator NlpD